MCAAILILASVVAASCAPRGTARNEQQPSPAQRAEASPVVEVVLREFEIEPRAMEVKAGLVRFRVTNKGMVEHDFVISAVEGYTDHDQHIVRPGETKVFEMHLKSGSHEVLCTLPGHKEAGMVGQIRASD